MRYHDAQGREHRERVGSRTLAREVYEKRKTEIREQRFFPERLEKKARKTVEQLLESYKEKAERDGRTVTNSDIAYRRITNRFGSRLPESLTTDDLENWKRELEQEGLSGSTSRKHFILLRAILRTTGATPAAFRKFKMPADGAERVRFLSAKEERRLLDACEQSWLRRLVLFCMLSGLRRGEALSLRIKNCDLDHGRIYVERGKNGKNGWHPLPQRAVAALREQVAGRTTDAEDRVFVTTRGGNPGSNWSKLWGPAVRKSGLQDFHFHDLRHTYASRLVMAGVPLATVSSLLGQRCPHMVLRYAHLAPQHLKDAVSVLDAGAGFGAGSNRKTAEKTETKRKKRSAGKPRAQKAFVQFREHSQRVSEAI